ncbi:MULTISPECIES: hypothetical protein [Halorubrum]|uniref:Uncharacterized protein n=1 Tax=Halorubrum laminariae TaxID=1433523 RepID=A0ABD6BYH5_9EURY|nr:MULTISPECIES: hypothetical protein [Halorubrum]CDK38186.1 hypothetical protein BN903_386 [Halorubrum sp. AJ67]
MAPKTDTSLKSTDIANTTQLLQAPMSQVECGRAVLVRRNEADKIVQHAGRVTKRSHPFITLRQASHTVDVNLTEHDWELADWIPIRSPTERMLIKQEWEK